MTDRPILFSATMIRALLNGSKTQTRRVVISPDNPLHKPALNPNFDLWEWVADGPEPWSMGLIKLPCRREDRLWVREAFCWGSEGEKGAKDFPIYRANYNADGDTSWRLFKPWKPSIHMPRWASRITLPVINVRVERLQDISRRDAIAEGIELKKGIDDPAPVYRNYEMKTDYLHLPVDSFRTLWDSINGNSPGKAWADNPWICALTFEVQKRNIDEVAG